MTSYFGTKIGKTLRSDSLSPIEQAIAQKLGLAVKPLDTSTEKLVRLWMCVKPGMIADLACEIGGSFATGPLAAKALVKLSKSEKYGQLAKMLLGIDREAAGVAKEVVTEGSVLKADMHPPRTASSNSNSTQPRTASYGTNEPGAASPATEFVAPKASDAVPMKSPTQKGASPPSASASSTSLREGTSNGYALEKWPQAEFQPGGEVPRSYLRLRTEGSNIDADLVKMLKSNSNVNVLVKSEQGLTHARESEVFVKDRKVYLILDQSLLDGSAKNQKIINDHLRNALKLRGEIEVGIVPDVVLFRNADGRLENRINVATEVYQTDGGIMSAESLKGVKPGKPGDPVTWIQNSIRRGHTGEARFDAPGDQLHFAEENAKGFQQGGKVYFRNDTKEKVAQKQNIGAHESHLIGHELNHAKNTRLCEKLKTPEACGRIIEFFFASEMDGKAMGMPDGYRKFCRSDELNAHILSGRMRDRGMPRKYEQTVAIKEFSGQRRFIEALKEQVSNGKVIFSGNSIPEITVTVVTQILRRVLTA